MNAVAIQRCYCDRAQFRKRFQVVREQTNNLRTKVYLKCKLALKKKKVFYLKFLFQAEYSCYTNSPYVEWIIDSDVSYNLPSTALCWEPVEGAFI